MTRCSKIEVGKYLLVGILSLQGDYSKHANILNILEVKSIYVDSIKKLYKCDALIIPGGESTTMSKLINKYSLNSSLKDFSLDNNIFGTCAGAILMSNNAFDFRIFNIGCIDLEIRRNAYGTQIHSFIDDVSIPSLEKTIPGVFIRAPKIYNYDKCEVIAYYKKDPVLVRNKSHLISTFHPELTNDLTVHKYFIEMINEY